MALLWVVEERRKALIAEDAGDAGENLMQDATLGSLEPLAVDSDFLRVPRVLRDERLALPLVAEQNR
jgi:hypothetical protein